jgi:hypothetical protein
VTTPAQYLSEIQALKNHYIEQTWFSAEVAYYAAAGRVLDSLKDHLRFGCDFNKQKILFELGTLLKSLADLCIVTISHLDFINHNWDSSKEMVPAGINGCANSILNMIRSGDSSKRVHFLANACSHLGFSFEIISSQSLINLKG